MSRDEAAHAALGSRIKPRPLVAVRDRVHRAGARRRPGYVLLLVAMLMFAFFGLAALVIDLGMVRLTRMQLQSAADSAALEGLRFRDQIPAGWWNQTLPSGLTVQEAAQSAIGRPLASDPTQLSAADRDAIRRWAASYMVSNIFDDDMNPSDVDSSGDSGTPGNWGAGPVLGLSGGIAGSDPQLAAGQVLQVPPEGARVYKPSLQLNTSNQQQGDLVSGSYAPNAGYTGAHPHEEDSQYNRADFEPAAAATGSETAFLARLRRTNNVQGLDNEAGVSSSGPTIPFLFGRGSMIHAQPGAAYSPRQDGITVRATAISTAAPVSTGAATTATPVAAAVGAPVQLAAFSSGGNNNIAGAAPFAINLSAWNSIASTVGPSVAVTAKADGTLTTPTVSTPLGYLIVASAATIASGQGMPLAVGGQTANVVQIATQVGQAASFDPTTFWTELSSVLPSDGSAYVAVVQDSATSTSSIGTVLGFGWIKFTLPLALAGPSFTVQRSAIAPQNTSAAVPPELVASTTAISSIPAAQQQPILQPLLATVLVSTNVSPLPTTATP